MCIGPLQSYLLVFLLSILTPPSHIISSLRRSFSCTPQEFAEKMEPQFGKVQRSPTWPIASMYGVFTYILPLKNQANVGKYTIDGWYGLDLPMIGDMSDMMSPKWWWKWRECDLNGPSLSGIWKCLLFYLLFNGWLFVGIWWDFNTYQLPSRSKCILRRFIIS